MLERLGDVELPAHAKPGGFDHAAVHVGRARVYVAHTANDALDVIDGATQHLSCAPSPGSTGVAGALVSEEQDLVFTSNRGEDTIGIVRAGSRGGARRRSDVGVRPNGLAYDAQRHVLLAANVGDASMPGSFTVSVVDVAQSAVIADVPVAGRTRWAVFDRGSDCFYVNIADPPQIVVIEGRDPASWPGRSRFPRRVPTDWTSTSLAVASSAPVTASGSSPSRLDPGPCWTDGSTSSECPTSCSSIRGGGASTWRSGTRA